MVILFTFLFIVNLPNRGFFGQILYTLEEVIKRSLSFGDYHEEREHLLPV